MLKPLFIAIVGATLATMIVFSVLKARYPIFLASQTARESLTVTPEQQTELRNAERLSDMAAYAMVGATLCHVSSLCFAGFSNTKRTAWSLLVGLILGAATGALCGWIGHALDMSPWFDIQDPIVYNVVRSSLMFLPVALAAAICTRITIGSFQQTANALVGALLGIVAGSTLYALLMGVVSANETRSKILPFHDTNRMMIVFLSVLCVSIGIGLVSTKNMTETKPTSPTS